MHVDISSFCVTTDAEDEKVLFIEDELFFDVLTEFRDTDDELLCELSEEELIELEKISVRREGRYVSVSPKLEGK